MNRLLPAIVALLCACGALPAADEVAAIVAEAKAPARFAGRTPAFRAETRAFTWVNPGGTENVTHTLIWDGAKLVGFYDPRMAQLDLITNPDDATDKPEFPTRYHWAWLFGARCSLGLWYDGQYISSQQNGLTVSGGGETITLTFTEQWTRKRKAESTCTAVLRLDPALGYAVTLTYRLSTDDARKRTIEFCNHVPGQMVSPWPDRVRYDRTVMTPRGSDGVMGWWNNLPAADVSDNGRKLTVRDGGFLAYLPGRQDRAKGWGVAMAVLTANGTASSQTCNAWEDQHLSFDLPAKPGDDGRFVIDATLRMSGLPPEAAAEVGKRAVLDSFNGDRVVQLRLGQVEGFEDQPLPLTTDVRAPFVKDWKIANDKGHTGTRSLIVPGIPADKPVGMSGFMHGPQVELVAGARYRASAWVQTSDPATSAVIRASFYEYSPFDGKRLSEVSSETAASPDGWKQITLEFTADKLGPFLDLRLLDLGGGTAWYDDVEIVRL
jgi:hypothetical protein